MSHRKIEINTDYSCAYSLIIAIYLSRLYKYSLQSICTIDNLSNDQH